MTKMNDGGGVLKMDVKFLYGIIPAGTEVEVPLTDDEGFGNIIVEEQNVVLYLTGMKVADFVIFDDEIRICPRCQEKVTDTTLETCPSCNYELDADIEGWLDDDTGDIGPNHRYTVENHTMVRVLLGGKDDYGTSHSGKIGMIEGFDYNTVPLKVFVQFPDAQGEYSGDKIFEFAYYDVAPVDAEEA